MLVIVVISTSRSPRFIHIFRDSFSIHIIALKVEYSITRHHFPFERALNMALNDGNYGVGENISTSQLFLLEELARSGNLGAFSFGDRQSRGASI